jgi:hypothetical protein
MVTVINLEVVGVSEYSLDWTDVAVVGGGVFGLAEGGVEVLSPAAERPAGYAEWGQVELPDGDEGFAVPLCRIRGQAGGEITVQSLGLENGEETERSYTMGEWAGGGERDRQELLARDVDFTSVAFSLEGQGLELSAFRLAVERIQDWRR